jgi:trans-2,3-dihydro-3-hydroxyanthranilate isomerase
VADSFESLAGFDPLDARRGGGASGRPGRRRYALLDVFTTGREGGNQLAVVPDGRGVDAGHMQSLALEFNLSETVFLLPPTQGGDVHARIFTPRHELPFAGHPVLGAAVFAGAALGHERVVLETGAGMVPVALRWPAGAPARGAMDQPLPTWAPYEQVAPLLAALGVGAGERPVGDAGLPVERYTNGPSHVYVELAHEDAVARLAPDLAQLALLGEIGVSCFAASGAEVKTRNFAPGLGVGEDPATGSAAGPLAVHLARHGRTAFGEWVRISQGVELGRPSLLEARVDGSTDRLERVRVAGTAMFRAAGVVEL